MKDVSRRRERFLRDGRDRRFGNVASNLLRVHHWLLMGRAADTVTDLMRETASMIEWTGDDATEELVNVHRELCRWRRIWPLEPARGLLAFRARQMSDHVLELSRLAESPSREG